MLYLKIIIYVDNIIDCKVFLNTLLKIFPHEARPYR